MSETMELEFTDEQVELLATIAANVAGGRHEFRADATIRAKSRELVAKVRRNKRNAARREQYKWRMVGERFAFDIGYGELESAIAEWQDALKSRPYSETHMRNVARALLSPKRFAAHCKRLADSRILASEELFEEFVDSERARLLSNWRAEVREYVEWRDSVAEIGMRIPVSLADMRADHGSRFFNYAVRKWNTAGYAEFLFGADVSDAFQEGMLSCIESGDWINPKKDGRIRGNKVPAYGALWRHISLAVRRAIWRNTRFTYDAPEPEFDWAEWERTANAEIPAVAFRTDSANRQELHEWAEYQEWRAVRDAIRATQELVNAERRDRLAMIDISRRAMAELLMQGVKVGTIAKALGRTVESLASDIDADEMRPAMRFLPTRGMTDSEVAERESRIRAEREHAELLRIRHRALQAENYANGRVFRRGTGSTARAVAEFPNDATSGVKCSVVAQGSQR